MWHPDGPGPGEDKEKATCVRASEGSAAEELPSFSPRHQARLITPFACHETE